MADHSDVPPMIEDSDTTPMRMDDLMCTTDGVNPIVDDAMKAYIEDILAEEAKNLHIDLVDDVKANHVAQEIEITEEELAKMEADQQATYEKAAAEEAAKVAAAEAEAADDDGFQVVGKKGKTKKPTPAPTSTGSSSLPSRGPAGEVHRAAAPEVRPKMKGDSKYPFCFTCSVRHDFGACGSSFPDSDDDY